MSTKVTNTDRYPVTPDQMIATLSDADYAKAKYEALGDIRSTVETQDATDSTFEYKVSREVPSTLPSVAKKVMGETNNLIQSEKWAKVGDSWKATVSIESPGAPVDITGDYQIVPAGDGCDYGVVLEIKAKVPFVGGKIEKSIAAETKESMTKELAFNLEWLAK